ncbi:MAG TPA: protein phosphatase CheZ [Deltaproteobacteria bacterium]|nr:protein phosphatase CheZ [Deltaproteobacteria bacterium]
MGLLKIVDPLSEYGESKENPMAKTVKGKKLDGTKDILKQADALKEYIEKGGEESIRELAVFMDILKGVIVSLAEGDLEGTTGFLKQLGTTATSELFLGIGEITRDLHESIKDIQNFLEPILNHLSEEDVQGLTTKLTHVSSLVKDTSERTLDLLFARQEIALADNVVYDAIARMIVSDDKKGALTKLKSLKTHNTELVGELMRISELQIHSDLVDQLIKKVSHVVENLELRLVDLIRKYDAQHTALKRQRKTARGGTKLHGPVVCSSDKVASSQDDVDSLLKSFGL